MRHRGGDVRAWKKSGRVERVARGWDIPLGSIVEIRPDPHGSRAERREARRRGITAQPNRADGDG